MNRDDRGRLPKKNVGPALVPRRKPYDPHDSGGKRRGKSGGDSIASVKGLSVEYPRLGRNSTQG